MWNASLVDLILMRRYSVSVWPQYLASVIGLAGARATTIVPAFETVVSTDEEAVVELAPFGSSFPALTVSLLSSIPDISVVAAISKVKKSFPEAEVVLDERSAFTNNLFVLPAGIVQAKLLNLIVPVELLRLLL